MTQLVNLNLVPNQDDTSTTLEFHAVSGQMGTIPSEWVTRNTSFEQAKRLTMLVRKSATGKTDKVTLRLRTPVIQSSMMAGQSVVDYNTVSVEATLPRSGTVNHRTELLSLMITALQQVSVAESFIYASPHN